MHRPNIKPVKVGVEMRKICLWDKRNNSRMWKEWGLQKVQKSDLLFCFSFFFCKCLLQNTANTECAGGCDERGLKPYDAIGRTVCKLVKPQVMVSSWTQTWMRKSCSKLRCACVWWKTLSQIMGSAAKVFLKYSKFPLRSPSFPPGLMN